MSALFDLTGQNAIVTGSSKGIGKAIAHQLAAHGANVVISSRKADVCDAARDEINTAVGREAAVTIPANIADKGALQTLVDETHARSCRTTSSPTTGSSRWSRRR
ncbi:MAG: short-chain dehydrogenase/reductase SDR [Alphaproteobacteria bacterium]|nr:MAG: short-chain dehydrogenase/reductase SDR [Alphaproteobacteria bacterium]